MRVYRFMSHEELELFKSGKKIIGKEEFNARTDSTGVCFLRRETFAVSMDDYGDSLYNKVYRYSPLEAFKFLKEVVSNELLVCFDTNAHFNHTYGQYENPYEDYYTHPGIQIGELCIPKYSKRGFMIRAVYDMQNKELIFPSVDGEGAKLALVQDFFM